jgi:thiosulfate dehydrogenase [quinone] large subunit
MSSKNKYSFLNTEANYQGWKIAGLIILCIRFVQGWIFWAGASRRFIYDPEKMDPNAANWMANKLQSSMPGALLGLSHVVSFLLQHFILLYIALFLMSLIELLSGIALIIGFFTRLAGFITALISVLMMLLFGWEGATCVDEWTMAVSGFSLGLCLALSGASIYSIDSLLLSRRPNLARKRWFLVLASGPITFNSLRKTSLVFLIFTVIFTLSTYNYYRGAIFSPYHGGPVSPRLHHLKLSDGILYENGSVQFTAYVDSGTSALPGYILRVELEDSAGKIIESWEGKQLNVLPKNNIINAYRYNKFFTGPFGIVAPVGAKAKILIPASANNLKLSSGNYQLIVFTIDGRRWDLNLKL